MTEATDISFEFGMQKVYHFAKGYSDLQNHMLQPPLIPVGLMGEARYEQTLDLAVKWS